MDSSIIYKETVMKRCETIWREALSDFPTSGLSLRKYCQERHLSYVRALYWRRRLAAEESALTFAVVRLPDAGQPLDSGVAVECGGHRIRLDSSFDGAVLLRVVALLSGQER